MIYPWFLPIHVLIPPPPLYVQIPEWELVAENAGVHLQVCGEGDQPHRYLQGKGRPAAVHIQLRAS